MLSAPPPYPPATIPPSSYYTPTPMPTLAAHPLATTGTDVLPGVVVALALIAVAVVALILTNHRKARP